jgi:hypothetical protein
MKTSQMLVTAVTVTSIVLGTEAAAQSDVPALGQGSEQRPHYAPFRWSPVPAGERVMTHPAVGEPSTSPPTDPRLPATPPRELRRDSWPRYAPFRWSPVPAVRGGGHAY